MYIKSLYLKNFKRFKELLVEFPSDITVIKGPNEQGKSSIVEALIAALFYDPGKSNEAIRGLQAWGNEKLYSMTLGFEAQGSDYTLEKDFEAKKIALVDLGSGELISNDYKEIAKRLSQLGGYQTPELFFNTACVKQGELAILDKKQTIAEALQDVVSGGGLSISLASIIKRAEKALDDLRRGLGRGMAKNPGVIMRHQREIEERANELAEKKRVFEEEDKARQRLGKLGSGRGLARENLELKEKVYKKGIVYFETQKVLEGLNGEHAQIQKKRDAILELQNEREKLDKEKKALKPFADLDTREYHAAWQGVERLDKEIGEKEERLESMRAKGARVREIVNPKYLVPWAALLGIGFLGAVVHPAFFMSWVAFGLFAFWAAFSKTFFRRITRRRLEQEVENLQKERERSAGKLQKDFEGLGVKSVEEIEQKKKEISDLQGRVGNIESKIEGILGDETLQKIDDRRKELEKRIAVEEAKMERQAARPLSLEEQTRLEQDIGTLQKQLALLDKEVTEIEAVLAHAKAPYADIVALEERIFSRKEDLERAQRKEKVLAVLAESLQEAQQKTFRSTQKVLEQYIGEYLSEITEGKYSKISIGPQMKIRVFSPEKGEEVEPENNLSQGALEQLYLVARFALISLLYGGSSPAENPLPLEGGGKKELATAGVAEKSAKTSSNQASESNPTPRVGFDSENGQAAPRPLVILDDPFGSFDPRRKARVRHILKKLSQNFQIIFLTCSDEYDKWGNVVKLA